MKFSEILSTTVDMEQIPIRRISELAQEQLGIQINFRRISEYKSGKVIATYEKAKAIAQVLGLQLSEQEILQALKEDREGKRSEYYPNNTVNSDIMKKTVNINLSKLLANNVEGEMAKRFVMDRVAELYGDENAFSKYIEGLIAYDLKNRILEKEEENTENA